MPTVARFAPLAQTFGLIIMIFGLSLVIPAAFSHLLGDGAERRTLLTALTEAVASARRQAEVAARAAGGTIVELMELTINDFERPEPRGMVMMTMKAEGADASAPISAGMNSVTVSVSTRWKFARQP